MATPILLKRAMRTNAMQSVIGFAIAAYIKSFSLTWRIDRAPFPVKEPYILAAWHGRLLLLPILRNTGKPLVALISGHRDGRNVSKAAAHFEIMTATGSSSRGGMRAVRELMRQARNGHSLFVTPDGPRGPRMRVNPGIIDLARLTGLPILPVGVSAGRGINLNTWDRFLLPGFFTNVVIRWGEPIRVNDSDDRAEIAAALETTMIELQKQVDHMVGRPPIEPA